MVMLVEDSMVYSILETLGCIVTYVRGQYGMSERRIWLYIVTCIKELYGMSERHTE